MADHRCAYPDKACGQLGLRYSSEGGTCAKSASGSCIAQVVAGNAFTCALITDGSVWCWGANDEGQLGDGQAPGGFRFAPKKVALPSAAKSVSGGEGTACALLVDGNVYCWGNDDSHQVGQGEGSPKSGSVPLKLAFAADALPIKSLSFGGRHGCVVDAMGLVRCWGENNVDQCGQPTKLPCPGGAPGTDCADVPAPTPLAKQEFTAIVVGVGDEFSCAIDDTKAVHCWGDDSLGELGVGTQGVMGDPSSPQRTGVGAFASIDANNGVPAFSAGDEHACAVSGGSVLCWGSNGAGEIGTGSKSPAEPTPKVVASAHFVVSGPAAKHTCTVDSDDGALTCWGNNVDGELGIGNADEANGPRPVPIVAVKSLALGDKHSCAVISTGELYCWGANDQGQLGVEPNGVVLAPSADTIVKGICP